MIAGIASLAFTGMGDTIAYWQFDTDGGLGHHLHASVGGSSYNLSQVGGGVAASGLHSGSPITNPDSSAGFTGGAAASNTGSGLGTGGGSNYLRSDPGDDALNLSGNSWTLEGFFQLEASPGGLDVLMHTRSVGGQGMLLTLRDGTTSNAKANLFVSDGSSTIDSDFFDGSILFGTTPRQWHHYALTWDGSEFEFFLDGASGGTLSSGALNLSNVDNNDSGHLELIGRSTFPGNGLNGRIDEFRISDLALGSGDFLNSVPEPSSLALLVGGGVLLQALRKRKSVLR